MTSTEKPVAWLFPRRDLAVEALRQLAQADWAVNLGRMQAQRSGTSVQCFVVNASGDENRLRGQYFAAVETFGVYGRALDIARRQVRP